MGPLLASAGIAGLAIGFGAQTLVKDFINGFFILAENQYDIGDTVRIAGVQGVVENMTLRRTVCATPTEPSIPSPAVKSRWSAISPVIGHRSTCTFPWRMAPIASG